MPKQSLKFWRTPRFKSLQSEWERKLKESGFIDVEREGKLIQNAPNSYRTKVEVMIEAKRRYYDLLGQGVHEEPDFRDDVERYIITRRAEGVQIKQIGIELKATGHRNSVETIRLTLRHYEKKWGIKRKKQI